MIPLCKPQIKSTDLRAAKSVLKTGRLVQNSKVKDLEKLVAKLTNSQHAIAMSSCTAALHTTLLGLNVQPNDLVIVSAYSWVATSNVVDIIGAKPIFIDIDDKTFNMKPSDLEQTLNSLKKSDQLNSLKAVILVHAFGTMAETEKISDICNRFNVQLIEDAACALGASEGDKHAGSIGKAGCFSFHPRKLVTTGEGGMIITNDQKLADFARAFRDHGKKAVNGNSKFIMSGLNYRMTDFQAALGIGQIKRLESNLKKRKRIAYRYLEILKDLPLQLPVPKGNASTWQSFVVLIPPDRRRDLLIAELAKEGVESSIGTIGLPFVNNRELQPINDLESLKVVKKVENSSIALPMFESLNNRQMKKIYRSLKKVLD